MPNPKVGTVSADVAGAVKNAKAGQVQFKTDKGGIVHCSIGSVQFDAPKLEENLKALVADLVKAKPSSAKGVYIKESYCFLNHGCWGELRSISSSIRVD